MSDEEGHHGGGSDEFDGVDEATVAAYHQARKAYREAKIELKHKKSSTRRKQEDIEHDDMALQQQRAHILADLRQQVAAADEALEDERRKQRSVEQEISTLRGRLTHNSKEFAQFESIPDTGAARGGGSPFRVATAATLVRGASCGVCGSKEAERQRLALT